MPRLNASFVPVGDHVGLESVWSPLVAKVAFDLRSMTMCAYPLSPTAWLNAKAVWLRSHDGEPLTASAELRTSARVLKVAGSSDRIESL